MPLPTGTVGTSCQSPTMKTCIRCETAKSVDEFHTRKRADGTRVPRGTCKVCQAKQTADARRQDPERFRGYWQTWASKTSRRERALREKYGMTVEEWDAILEAQGGTCAICDGPAQAIKSGGVEGEPQFHSDHNHRTGEFRGILCGLCNRMLGQALDDPERLLAGARYLQARGH